MKKMFLFALVTTLFITSCGQKQKGSNTLIRPVKTAQISSQSVIRKDFSGIVEAVEYVRLAFRVSGQIISLPVVEGQRVKKGQLIAAIDPRDISLQYAADKAAPVQADIPNKPCPDHYPKHIYTTHIMSTDL